AVVVVIEPHGARTPAGAGDAGPFGHICECAIAIVAIKNVAAELRDTEVGESVAVVITDGDAHAVSAACHSSLFRYVGEGAVAIVPVERIAERARRRIKICLAAVDQIDVHPAVVVVVEEGTPGAARFRQVLFGGLAGGVNPRDAAAGRRNLLEGGLRRRGTGRKQLK